MSDSSGEVRLVRVDAPWRDRFRAYKVMLDGSAAGEIRNGGEVRFEVGAGRHQLRVKVGLLWGSNVLMIDVKPGEVVGCECRPNGSSLTSAFDVCSWRKPWVDLRRAQEPW
jgi:hypothetical protein